MRCSKCNGELEKDRVKYSPKHPFVCLKCQKEANRNRYYKLKIKRT